MAHPLSKSRTPSGPFSFVLANETRWYSIIAIPLRPRKRETEKTCPRTAPVHLAAPMPHAPHCSRTPSSCPPAAPTAPPPALLVATPVAPVGHDDSACRLLGTAHTGPSAPLLALPTPHPQGLMPTPPPRRTLPTPPPSLPPPQKKRDVSRETSRSRSDLPWMQGLALYAGPGRKTALTAPSPPAGPPPSPGGAGRSAPPRRRSAVRSAGPGPPGPPRGGSGSRRRPPR